MQPVFVCSPPPVLSTLLPRCLPVLFNLLSCPGTRCVFGNFADTPLWVPPVPPVRPEYWSEAV
uniref:Uncharacterized protein n=1 Tax=Anguilla anguilla TaxID=7936 RepID=A0A0E9P824_ANGAN